MITTDPIFAASAHRWPDGIDSVITGVYLIAIFALPMLGYVVMVMDFRRYLRSLRRAMVRVVNVMPSTPYWALLERPTCLKAFDLQWPCTEAEVMAAYREKAKRTHPDRGGDLQQFLNLQQQFEQALKLVRGQHE